ncbi:MAG: glycosyltransferase [Spirochaetes bacterium]|nr:glycosyltransferase [Spirochaetota bacterium]
MKILLVTRGSVGDVYPYIRLAGELKKRGHEITLSIPRIFEKEGRESGLNYVLQAMDDIAGLIQGKTHTKNLLDWTQRVIASQFNELVPLLQEHDLMVAANTEFAAVSVGEYCGKPCIRTAYGPFIPGRNIPPPVFPWPARHPVFTPAFLWKLLNIGLNYMAKKELNRHRVALGMPKVKELGHHAPANAASNYLMYSRHLGSVDSEWQYKWEIGGYCFNDDFPYDSAELEKLVAFIKKDSRPTVWFSLGSCYAAERDVFAEMLFDICRERGYKLAVACGWWNTGATINGADNFYRMESPIPHCHIFPHCDAIIHHGGAGTTHSAARSGRPQAVVPLLLDQPYWAWRVKELGIGPGGIKIKGCTRGELEKKVTDLVSNPSYKEKAAALGELISAEAGLENACQFIEGFLR